MLSFFSRGVLDEILNLIESFSEGFFFLLLTGKFLRQGYRYHKIRKTYTKFYRRHFDIVSKYDAGLKTLLLQDLSEPEFYGDLMYKFRKINNKNDFLIISKR